MRVPAKHLYTRSNVRRAVAPSQIRLSMAPLIMEKCGTVCPMSISQMTGMSGNAVRMRRGFAPVRAERDEFRKKLCHRLLTS